jgi:glutamate racemase
MATQKDRRVSIGVMDTGLGGLLVVEELARLIEEKGLSYRYRIEYVADNKNFPYGNKPSNYTLGLHNV